MAESCLWWHDRSVLVHDRRTPTLHNGHQHCTADSNIAHCIGFFFLNWKLPPFNPTTLSITAEKLPPLTAPCNEECFVSFVSSLYQSGGEDCSLFPRYSQVMLLHACHKLLSDLESTKYLRFFYAEGEKQKPTGKRQNQGSDVGVREDVHQDFVGGEFGSTAMGARKIRIFFGAFVGASPSVLILILLNQGLGK